MKKVVVHSQKTVFDDFFPIEESILSFERIWLYLAEVTEADQTGKGGGVAEEHEDIRRVEWPLSRFWQELDAGKIQDAKTLVAGWWLRAQYHYSEKESV